jgi:hypothetical protein
MATTRAQFRTHIGKALGRRYYASSTTTGTSTVNELVDSKRTEHRSEWDGAAILISGQRTLVRGGQPESGRLLLDTDLSSPPATGTAYELLKGWTFDDLDEAIDWAHAEAWPHLFLPVDDTATVEVASQNVYALAEAWRSITRILRQDKDSAPTTYSELRPGHDYELRAGAAGFSLELFYTPEAGRKLRVVGRSLLTIGAADASSSTAPWQVITPGSLAWVYDKGADAAEDALRRTFEEEAGKKLAEFEAAKRRYTMPRETPRARTFRMVTVNTGSRTAT